ncbi:MAG: Hpt domain-containing protein, partial [Methylococcales bacterium]|nr:Hpt domain-containing protein [Methylococcales bacterium]
MAVDLDDEILQDFLVEAGEILELLGEQLVELEQSPEDLDLLNAIFRGFHTIKGGAGFLALDPLVAVCHKAEDVFNVLRQGERQVNAELMDVILEVVDIVNLMFDQVKAGNDAEAADDSLLTRLQAFTSAGSAEKTIVESPPEPIVEEKAVVDVPVVADFVEQEFEAMLEDVSESEVNAVASDNDEITEDEFDSLLDNLHGKGQFSAQGLQQEPDEATPEQEITAVPVDPGDITEDEFDSLLDELHGKGQFSAASLKEEQVPEAVVDSGDITE